MITNIINGSIMNTYFFEYKLSQIRSDQRHLIILIILTTLNQQIFDQNLENVKVSNDNYVCFILIKSNKYKKRTNNLFF